MIDTIKLIRGIFEECKKHRCADTHMPEHIDSLKQVLDAYKNEPSTDIIGLMAEIEAEIALCKTTNTLSYFDNNYRIRRIQEP